MAEPENVARVIGNLGTLRNYLTRRDAGELGRVTVWGERRGSAEEDGPGEPKRYIFKNVRYVHS